MESCGCRIRLLCAPSRVTRALRSAYIAIPPCCSLVPGARPTRRRPIASSVCPPSKLTRRRLGALSHQRHGCPHPRSSSSGNTLLHPPVARAPVLARATPRLSRRCRSFSSSFSSRARSYVEHGRKGLWFHRRCRGKWSCQKQGPPPAPPLLRRRPHNKPTFPCTAFPERLNVTALL